MSPGLEPYKTLQERTHQMLEAVRAGEWEHYIELEQQCAQIRDALMLQPSLVSSAPSLQNNELAAIIKDILTCHEDILSYVLPRQKDVKQLLDSFSNTQRLQQSYGLADTLP